MIELAGLHIDRPGAPVLRGADLTVHAGDIVLVSGGAGAGSSIIVATLLGDHAATSGEVVVLGKQLRRLRRSALRRLRTRIGIVPQDLCLLDDASALRNVALPLELDGVGRKAAGIAAKEQLELLGVEHVAGTVVQALPWALRQRVAVARALVRRPDVIVADSPTNLQDRGGCDLVASAIAGAAATGAACLLFGRDDGLRQLAEQRGWRQLVLHDGNLIPQAQIELSGAAIDELLVDVESLPSRRRVVAELEPERGGDTDRNVAVPALMPFPSTARIAGAR